MKDPGSDLLLRLRAGDLGAFEELVDHYERRLIRYFFGLSGDAQLAEDCAQEVFVRLYRARETYSPDAAFSTFVFRIARNLWIDVYRGRKVRPQMASLDAPTGDDEGSRGAMVERVESGAETPEDRVVAAEDQDRLRAAIAKLPDGQRAVLDLVGGQGLKYEHVAEVLGIPIGTVKSRVHAAVQLLRRMLGPGPK